jgi:putative endonuclease
MVHSTRVLGDKGELVVADFLMQKGYSIIARNVRWVGGEIDLIASRQNLLTFVEVKLRRRESPFPLSSVVTLAKQRKIIKTALRFVVQHDIQDVVLRFDIALVTLTASFEPEINYISNAFTAAE